MRVGDSMYGGVENLGPNVCFVLVQRARVVYVWETSALEATWI